MIEWLPSFPPMDAVIRPATSDDHDAMLGIYNHFVEHEVSTFDVDSLTELPDWVVGAGDSGPYRVFVAVVGTDVVGWCVSSQVRRKAAYAESVEVTIYLDPPHSGKRLGTRLYTALFEALEQEGIHRAYAAIAGENAQSVALHEQFGFHHVGTWSEVGLKFGDYVDVAWYEKAF